MSNRKATLNSIQREVLAWVRDGTPDGIYKDWSHRVTARALHNRGLVVVRGHGPSWSATLTDGGAHYLDNGTYQSADDSAAGERVDVDVQTTLQNPPSSDTDKSSTAPTGTPEKLPPRPPKPPRNPGPLDQMMIELREAVNHLIVIPRNEEGRYRQLVGSAKRFGRIPDGWEINFGWDKERKRTLKLEPLPEWQTRVLNPITVPQRLRDPSDVTLALSESNTFQVSGEPRKRALRLAEALTTAARDRGMQVKSLLNQPVNRNYDYRGGPRRDEMEFALENDRFRVWFTQATLKEPHEATPREIARARNGYLFPDHDNVQDIQLGLELDGEGRTFWASSWSDADENSLEQELAQVLEEIRLRHESLVDHRQAERQRAIAQRRQSEEDRIAAVAKYRHQFLVDAMKEQATQWEEADRLRNYAAAIRDAVPQWNRGERDEALSWAGRIEAQADSTDPLPGSARAPEIPEPSQGELSPFLKSRSSYGW